MYKVWQKGDERILKAKLKIIGTVRRVEDWESKDLFSASTVRLKFLIFFSFATQDTMHQTHNVYEVSSC